MDENNDLELGSQEYIGREMTDIEKANYDAIQDRQNPSADRILGLYFPVLDHGFVALKDYCGSDAAIAQAARCSYGAGTRAISDDRNLIRYLVSHKHTSPLEQCELKFHMKLPIMVARQMIRHRTASVNEISGRYSIMPLQFYTPEIQDIKNQSKFNKQGRDDAVDTKIAVDFTINLDKGREVIKEGYVSALKCDIARELARIDLPLSTFTEWYWKMDLNNLMHLLSLRCDGHAQWEIRQYANLIAGITKYVAPSAYEAWIDYAYSAVSFSRQERILLNSQEKPTQEKALELGMSKREWNEFLEKIHYDGSIPDFNLDISKAKSPEFFRKEAEKYVPEIG